MIHKRILSILLLSTLFLNPAFSAECKKLFNKLDKQHYAISGKDRVKKLVKLENDLFKAIEQCKKYSGMFVLMGELQIDMGQVPLSVVYGRKSVELDENYWRAYKLLGSAQMLNSDFERGLNSLKKSVELAPGNTNAQLNLASALVQNKKHDEALTLVNEIIKKNKKGTIATAYYLRSQAYSGKGLIIEADKDIKRAQGMGFVVEQR